MSLIWLSLFYIYQCMSQILRYESLICLYVFILWLCSTNKTLLVRAMMVYWEKYFHCISLLTDSVYEPQCQFMCLFPQCIFNRPGVAGAVLQTASSLIHSVGQPFPPNLQNIINHKPEELGSWNFERMFTPHNMSHVTCCMSRVTCHMSYVIIIIFFYKVVKFMGGGSVINGAYPV